jgi:hypothetical protein
MSSSLSLPILFFASDIHTVLFSCILDPSKVLCALGLITYVGKHTADEVARIYVDPPDYNFQEVATIELVTPFEPLDSSPLAVAKARFATVLAEQNAILEVVLTTIERLQGAIVAEEPLFIILQTTALKHYFQLLTYNQQDLKEALNLLGIEFIAFTTPIYDELIQELILRSEEGLSPEERESLQQAGLTSEEIQTIEEIFDAIPTVLDGGLHNNYQTSIDQWIQLINETILPSLEQGRNESEVLINSFAVPCNLYSKLEIKDDEFEVKGSFTLGASSDGIEPIAQPVILNVGTFITVIPPGFFKFDDGIYKFEKETNNEELEVKFKPIGNNIFKFKAEGKCSDCYEMSNPIELTLIIGDDIGTTNVIAELK